MTFNDLMLVLSRLGVDTDSVSSSRPNQVLIPCVLAKWMHKSGSDSHPSLSIRYGDPKEWTVFKCFACKEQGRLWQLVDSYGHLSEDDEIKKIGLQLLESDKPSLATRLAGIAETFDEWFTFTDEGETRVLHEDILERFIPAYENERAKSYLEHRKVSADDCTKFDLRYDPRSDRVLFPVRTEKNELVGAVGRLLGDGEPRYWNYLGFPAGNTLGGLHRVSGCPTVIVVEGFFDLLRCHSWAAEVGADVVCTWRAELSKVQAGILSGLDKNIQCWYDQDDAGRKGFSVMQKHLAGTYGLKRATWSGKDDVGDMSHEKFVSIFQSLKGEIFDGC